MEEMEITKSTLCLMMRMLFTEGGKTMATFLNNGWSLSGSDTKDFFTSCEIIDAKTSHRKIDFNDVILHHIFKDEDGNVKSMMIDPAKKLPDALMEGDGRLASFVEDVLPSELVDETVKDGLAFTLRSNGNETFFLISPQAYSTLGQRINLPGAAMQYSSIGRECHIADHIANHKEKQYCTAVVKQDNGVDKIFAVLSETYKAIDLFVLKKITESLTTTSKMGNPTCLRWYIDHYMAEIVLSFPDHGKEICDSYGIEPMTPCVKLQSSDTGECAVRAVGFWKTNEGDEILTDEFSRTHKGKFTAADVVEGVKKDVFDKYEVLPKKLQELSFIPVTPKLDLSKAKNCAYNAEILKRVYMTVITNCKVPSVLGKKRTAELEEQLTYMIDASAHYSAYAVAKDIMSLPSFLESWVYTAAPNVKSGDAVMEKLQKAVSQAPYEPYEMITERAMKKVPAVYLVAE